MYDSFGRQITYARISVTDLCNLRCKYCMPEGIEKKAHSDILSIESLIKISDALSELGVTKQRITGGEPLVRKGVDGLFSHIGRNPLVSELAITTNGQLLKEKASSLLSSNVTAVNVSLDTLDEGKYSELTKGGSLAAALEGIAEAGAVGFKKIKLNAVLLKGINDEDIYTMAKFARQQDLPIRFIELMPFASQKNYAKEFFISAKEIPKRYSLRLIDAQVEDDKVMTYAFEDGTVVGFISPLSNKFCSRCNRIRITADGKLLNCLHECREYDLKPYLDDKEALKSYISECVLLKPKEHRLVEGCLQCRIMEDIGG